MKLNLRDLFWLIFVSAVATMWWIDRSKLADRLKFYEGPPPADMPQPVATPPLAQPPNYPADPFGNSPLDAPDPFGPPPAPKPGPPPSADPFG